MNIFAKKLHKVYAKLKTANKIFAPSNDIQQEGISNIKKKSTNDILTLPFLFAKINYMVSMLLSISEFAAKVIAGLVGVGLAVAILVIFIIRSKKGD